MAGYKLKEGQRGAIYPAAIAIISVLAIFTLLSLYDLNVKNVAITQAHVPIFFAVIASITLIAGIAWSTWRTFKLENTLNEVMIETAKTTSMVFIILLGAAMLTAAFRGFGGEEYVREFLQGLPGGFWSQFIVVMAVIFVLGFFLDFIEIAVVVVPIVAPILLADPSANITAVWLGVMIGVNIQTSFLTPPFGFALFYLRGVASKAISTVAIYRGVIPFIILQLIALAIVGAVPPLVNYLPNRFYLSSFNAPPPQNPRLQECVEQYLAEAITDNKAEIAQSLTLLSSLDKTMLPKKIAGELEDAEKAAGSVFGHLETVQEAQAVLADAKISYAAFHAEVRSTQREMRKIDTLVKRLKREQLVVDAAEEKQHIADEIEEALARKDAYAATIPAEWEPTLKEYQAKQKDLNTANRKYRRAMDDGFSKIDETITLINAQGDLQAYQPKLNEIIAGLANLSNAEKQDVLKATEKEIGAITGSAPVKSLLSKARRAYKKDDNAKADGLIADALAQMDAEIAWRTQAIPTILPVLETYQNQTANTIGLRGQDRIPAFLVPRISGCRSKHKDISLQF